MLETHYPRDLAMVGAIFGLAAFMWSGWAQENPPTQWWWRAVLGLFAIAGLSLAALSISMAVSHWSAATALESGNVAFRVYLIVFWVEVVLAAVLAFIAVRAGRGDLIAPLVLAVVGVHFFALAPVFAQPVLYLAAVLLTTAAIVAAVVPSGSTARSFWCGLLGAPVFVAVGAWCTFAARAVFRDA